MDTLIIFTTVFAAVFIAELGDKTQLFVVGLSAKEKTRDIILGMCIAILLLNLIAIYLGGMLSGFIRPELIEFVSGFAFLLFAYLSLSEKKDEEGICKITRIAWVAVASMFFMAELGDKTQLSTIAFAAQLPGARPFVFLGATLGMLFADGLGLLFGIKLGKRIPDKLFSYISFAIFAAFGFISIWQGACAISSTFAVFTVVLTGCVFVLLISMQGIKGRKKRHS